MASLLKSERLISSRGHGCFTISPPQLPAAATRFPSHGSGRPGRELRTATKLSSAGFEPTDVLTFGLRVRRFNHSATRSPNTIPCLYWKCIGFAWSSLFFITATTYKSSFIFKNFCLLSCCVVCYRNISFFNRLWQFNAVLDV